MPLDQFRTFLTVYRTGTTTAAARALRLSQPTVTAQVKALEATLKRPLFDRLPHGMAPTPAADALARQLADPMDALESVLHSDPGAAETVHVGGPAEIMSAYVAPSLAPLIKRGLRLRLKLGQADRLLGDLAAGRLDLVVSTVPPRHRGIQAEVLSDEEFVMVASPGLAAEMTGTGPESLSRLPWISYAEDLPMIRRYWRMVFGERPTMAAAVVIPDQRGILAAALAGVGAAVLPSYICRDHLAEGLLVQLDSPEIAPLNTAYLAVQAGARNRPGVVAVHDHLIAINRSHSWS